MSSTAVILSWSGGKDSSLTLSALRAHPRFEVAALLTSVTRGYDRISIHGVRRELLVAQASAIGLPLVEIALEPGCSNLEYESAFLEGVTRAQEIIPQASHVAFGDLFLADVRAYRERLLARSTLAPLFPLWGTDTRALATQFIAEGFAARLVCVNTSQLAASFAGRAFDQVLLADLPPSVDPCGERGEFHTFVWKGPVFRNEIQIELGEVVLREERFAYCDLLPAAAGASQAPPQRAV